MTIGSEFMLPDDLYEILEETAVTGTNVLIGAPESETRKAVHDRFPDAEVFETSLEWLEEPAADPVEASIGVLVMVDQSELLVSSRTPTQAGEATEQAIYGSGFSNGLITIARRLLSYGLQEIQD